LQEAAQTGYLSARRWFSWRIFSLFVAGSVGLSPMDSFELNKILGAVLGTCLVLLALNITAGAIFAPHQPEKPGFNLPVPDQSGAAAVQAAKSEPDEPIAVRLANSDPKRGEAVAKQCAACHTFDKGGANKVGPNLYGIVNDEKGHGRNGFNFSAGMKAAGGTWTYEDLDQFITNPKGFIKGTSMGFAGLARPAQRADLISFLRSLSDNPAPLPTAAETPAKAPAK
jgi:cytochrome c